MTEPIDVEGTPEMAADEAASVETPADGGAAPDAEARPTGASAPAAGGVAYVETPNPFGEGDLLAHEHEALILDLAGSGPQRRIVITQDPAAWAGQEAAARRIHEVEEFAVRRMIAARRAWRARRLFWRLAALGLPFVVASLLGAAGLQITPIPAIGEPLAEFVSSAAASVGGLPAGVAVAAIPTLWIFWLTGERRARTLRLRPSRRAKRIQPELIPVGLAAYAEFLEDLAPLIEESRQLAMRRRTVAGDVAKRLEALFGAMYRAAKLHGIDAAAAMFTDFRRCMWRASALPYRRLGFISIRKPPARIRDLTAPYAPAEPPGRVASMAEFLRLPAGIAVAAGMFLLAGAYRLGPEEAEVLRPNQMLLLPGNLDVFSLTSGELDRTPEVFIDTVKTVEGPGWFWSWPAPLAQREHLLLSGRKITVESFLGLKGDGSVETVRAEFVFSVADTAKWVGLATKGGAEETAQDRLAQLLADHLALSRGQTEASRNRPPNLTEFLKEEMDQLLTSFVTQVNTQPEIIDLGIQVDTAGSYSFGLVPALIRAG